MKKFVSCLFLAMMCYCSKQPPCLRTLSFPVVMYSLRLDFAILLDMKARGVAVILIEHMMRAVLRFSERIAVLVAGRKIADGSPETVLHDPAVERAYLGQ